MERDCQDFDRLIRSMVENAEEEVPSRVWTSVSSRLGLAGRKKAFFLSWKRGISVAAAVAAAITAVFLGTRTSEKTTIEKQDVQARQEATPSIQIYHTNSAAMAGNLTASAESTSISLLPISSQDDSLALNIQNQEDVSVRSKEGLPATDIEEDKPEKKERPGQEAGILTEQFNKLAFEESKAKAKRGLAFNVGGNILSNGNASKTSPTYLGRIDGNGPAETFLVQLSKDASYSIPVSVGVGVKIPIGGRWSVKTGLNYTFLERTFTGVYTQVENSAIVKTVNDDFRHTVHYLGIPLNFCYDIYSGNRLQFYAYGGAEVERAIVNKIRIPDGSGHLFVKEGIKGVQASVAGGIGVSFQFTDLLGIYFDPNLRYFFDCNQPTSIRTQQPFQMGFEVGLRFSL